MYYDEFKKQQEIETNKFIDFARCEIFGVFKVTNSLIESINFLYAKYMNNSDQKLIDSCVRQGADGLNSIGIYQHEKSSSHNIDVYLIHEFFKKILIDEA